MTYTTIFWASAALLGLTLFALIPVVNMRRPKFTVWITTLFLLYAVLVGGMVFALMAKANAFSALKDRVAEEVHLPDDANPDVAPLLSHFVEVARNCKHAETLSLGPEWNTFSGPNLTATRNGIAGCVGRELDSMAGVSGEGANRVAALLEKSGVPVPAAWAGKPYDPNELPVRP